MIIPTGDVNQRFARSAPDSQDTARGPRAWAGEGAELSTVGQSPRAGGDSRGAVSAVDPTSEIMDRLSRFARQKQFGVGVDGNSSKAESNSSSNDQGSGSVEQKMQSLLQNMFGIKHISSMSFTTNASHAFASAQETTEKISQSTDENGAAFSYDYKDTYAQSEVYSLKAEGTFTTDEGQTFSFNIDYKMEISYAEQRSLHMQGAGNGPMDGLSQLSEGAPAQDQSPSDFFSGLRSPQSWKMPDIKNWFQQHGTKPDQSPIDQFIAQNPQDKELPLTKKLELEDLTRKLLPPIPKPGEGNEDMSTLIDSMRARIRELVQASLHVIPEADKPALDAQEVDQGQVASQDGVALGSQLNVQA